MKTETNIEHKYNQLQKQLASVLEVSESITGVIELTEVLNLVIHELGQNLGYKFPAIFLLDSKREKLMTRSIGVKPSFEKLIKTFFKKKPSDIFFPLSEKENILVKAVETNSLLVTKKLVDFTRPFVGAGGATIMQKALSTKLMIAVPLSIKNTTIGVLGASYKDDQISEAEKDVLKTFASQISIAIYNSQLFSKVQTQVVELKEQADDLEALHDLSTFAEASLEKESVAQDLLNIVPKKLGHLGVVGSALFMKDADNMVKAYGITQGLLTNKLIKVVVKNKMNKIYEPTEMPALFQDAFDHNKIVVLNSLNEVFPKTVKKRMEKTMKSLGKIKFFVLVPVMQQGLAIGLLLFAFSVEEEEFDERHREILRVFSNHVAIALDNAGLYRELQSKLAELEQQSEELRKANVQLTALDKSKSEFISIASHQLRTPLTVIKGYLSMMQEGSIQGCSGAAMDTVGKVSESADRLVVLVNDLLDVSRIERGKMVMEKKKGRLEDVAKSVFDELAVNAEEKGLDYVYHGPSKKTPLLNFDEQKLRQVMLNLIDNSIKYTPSGFIEVSVKQQNGKVLFVVKDSGIGMIPEEIDHLFKKFARGDEVSTLHTEGIGLGLFVAKKIITAHNGLIWAESEGKGKGSTFAFSLSTK